MALPRITNRLSDLAGELLEKSVMSIGMMAPARAQYQKLATTMHEMRESRHVKTVVIASAGAGEGKTLTAANLAVMLSESFKRRVLLVDADFRRPNLHTLFHVPFRPGFADMLTAGALGVSGRILVSETLTIVPAGETSDPIGILSSKNLQVVVEEAEKEFDWVLIDTPPVGPLSDAKLVAAHADGVLFVVSAAETPLPVVQRAVEAFGADRVLGFVLNRAEPRALEGGYGYDYDYDYYTSRRDGASR